MPISKKQNACVDRYKNKAYDRFNLLLPKGSKDIIRSAATVRGVSVNNYIRDAIRDALERDGLIMPESYRDGIEDGDQDAE